jgi:hypothetical protein
MRSGISSRVGGLTAPFCFAASLIVSDAVIVDTGAYTVAVAFVAAVDNCETCCVRFMLFLKLYEKSLTAM